MSEQEELKSDDQRYVEARKTLEWKQAIAKLLDKRLSHTLRTHHPHLFSSGG